MPICELDKSQTHKGRAKNFVHGIKTLFVYFYQLLKKISQPVVHYPFKFAETH